MRKVLTLLVHAAVPLLYISASAQTPSDARAILGKVNYTYSSLKRYQFEYKTVSDSKTERQGLTSTTRFESLNRIAAVRPGRIRVETQDWHSSVIFVADGQSVWLYSSEMNAYTKRPLGAINPFAGSKSQGSRHENLARSVNTKLAEYALLTADPRNLSRLPDETITFQGREIPCYVLSIIRGGGRNKERSQYWIHREMYLVLRESTDQTHSISPDSVTRSLQVVDFTITAIDELAPSSVFSFSPPKGAIEVDQLERRLVASKRNAPAIWVGKAAPNFTLTDLNGKTVSLQSLRGQAVLLNFWASWCGPCVAEMPYLEKLHREYKNKGVVILGIDDEGAEAAQAFLTRQGYTFNTLIDADKQVARLYKINAIPQSFFITRDGIIAAHDQGARREGELRAGLEKALAGMAEIKAAAALAAPKLVSPEHLSRFDHYPRRTVLVWEPAPGAAGYRVETDFQYSGTWASEDQGAPYVVEVTATNHTFNFVGAQPGRWRVWAFDANGREGAKSEWREFIYSR